MKASSVSHRSRSTKTCGRRWSCHAPHDPMTRQLPERNAVRLDKACEAFAVYALARLDADVAVAFPHGCRFTLKRFNLTRAT